jgi:hypothetical protein
MLQLLGAYSPRRPKIAERELKVPVLGFNLRLFPTRSWPASRELCWQVS